MKVQVQQDWNNDGFLRITGAETLVRYSELREKQHHIPVGKYGIFFAFSKEQFEQGYKGLVQRGLINDGDKVFRFGGGAYGTREGMRRRMEEDNAIDEQIRTECDPYEVYLYEYNNFECCIDWDGDQRAVEAVIRLFGYERAKAALQGRRYRACGSIEEIAKADN